jgi:dual specificity phosphatase 12
MNRIINNIYVGDHTSPSLDPVASFDLIVNCTKDLPTNSRGIREIRVPVDDAEFENDAMFGYLPGVTNEIQKVWSNGGTILIHCFAGISRSASVCAAYLMRYQGFMSVQETVRFMKTKRPIVFGNANFRFALEKFNNIYH